QQGAAGFAHLCVRLDGKHSIAIFQKKPGERAWARRDVGDYMLRLQATFRAQQLDYLGRITRPIADVILDPIGKSCGWRLTHTFQCNAPANVRCSRYNFPFMAKESTRGVQEISTVSVGDLAPDFELPALIGGVRTTFRLHDYRGKSILLAFYPFNWIDA